MEPNISTKVSFSKSEPGGLDAPLKKLESVNLNLGKQPSLLILYPRVNIGTLSRQKVSYQAAQFYYIGRKADVTWLDQIDNLPDAGDVKLLEKRLGKTFDAILVFDEYSLLKNAKINRLAFSTNALFVYISHDYWCHPLRVAEFIRRQPKALMVLRHESARKLFDHLLPRVPKVIQRPGVEISIFNPHDGKKSFDVLLGGSETPDYPLRQKINRVVRENADKFGWHVLDLTGKGLMSNPPDAQMEYSAALAASKISPTASNRGGSAGAKLTLQYFDLSPARAQFKDDFYGLENPEISFMKFETAGITPRYLESLASKSLLMADLPESDFQEWYTDKMVRLDMAMSDRELAELIDAWVKDDLGRENLSSFAYEKILESETSEKKAAELIEIILEHL